MTILAQIDPALPTVRAIAELSLQLLAFFAILLLGWLLARAVQRAVAALLDRFGFNRALERGGIRDALARGGHDAGELVSRLVFLALMLIVLQLAFGIFGPNPVSGLLERLIAFIPRVVVAIVLVVVAALVAAVVRDVVAALIGELPYGRALASVAYGVVLAVGVFAALDQLEIAPFIVVGVFYAALAIVVGVTVVAVGGGGIAVMRERWERALQRVDGEATRMRDEAQRQREAQREREAEEEARRQREAEAEAQRLAEAEAEAQRQRDARAEQARLQREAEAEARRQREAEAEAEAQRQRDARAEQARVEREAAAEARREREAARADRADSLITSTPPTPPPSDAADAVVEVEPIDEGDETDRIAERSTPPGASLGTDDGEPDGADEAPPPAIAADGDDETMRIGGDERTEQIAPVRDEADTQPTGKRSPRRRRTTDDT